ncbi:MAG: twin-arginine translocase subunit TatB [Planctomycetota bacterium]
MGKSIGQGIVEFKKGLKGINEEIEDASSQKKESLADSKKTPELSQPVGGEPMQSGTSDEAKVGQADPAG